MFLLKLRIRTKKIWRRKVRKIQINKVNLNDYLTKERMFFFCINKSCILKDVDHF